MAGSESDQGITEGVASLLASSPIPLVCGYLFGSYATCQARDDSDVDIAVLPTSDVSTGFMALTPLQGCLERNLGRAVDLVDLRQATPELIHYILRDGVLLRDNDPPRRVAFEVSSRNAYFDVLPYLEEYRRGPFA
jgi:predicted nucleotidyltransferase